MDRPAWFKELSKNKLKYSFKIADTCGPLNNYDLMCDYKVSKEGNELKFEVYYSIDEYRIIPEFCKYMVPSYLNLPTECFSGLICSIATPTNFKLLINNRKESELPIYKLSNINKSGVVHIIWVMLWCLSYKHTVGFDKEYRFDQLIGVLIRLINDDKEFKNWKSIYKEVINTVGSCGTSKMIFGVIGLMNKIGVKCIPAAKKAVFNIFINNSKNDLFNKETSVASQNCSFDFQNIDDVLIDKEYISECSKSINPNKYYYWSMRNGCKRRTIKDHANSLNWIIQDIINFDLKTVCSKCTLKINIFGDNRVIKCKSCETEFKPELIITHGIPQDELFTSIKLKIELIEIYQLLAKVRKFYQECLTNRNSFSFRKFREENEDMMWNCIFYFTYCNLPFDFILDYENEELVHKYEEANIENDIELFDPDE